MIFVETKIARPHYNTLLEKEINQDNVLNVETILMLQD